MSIFTKAYKILKENKITEDLIMPLSISYNVIGDTDNYFVRIYRKASSWFLQCGCNCGVSNNPWGLCKHGIITIVKQFLKENNLELKEKK